MALSMTSTAVDIPSDWDVSTHTPMASDTVNVYGNITVRAGGHLDLSNIDMVMKCTVDGQYTLAVDNGGKLTFNGGSIKADQAQYRYRVELRGEATLEGVTITDTWGSGAAFDASTNKEPPLTGLEGGVQVYSDDVYIGNCTMERGVLCMVYVSGASPTLYGNTISKVIYNVAHYQQDTSNPSTTRYSAMAFGVLMSGGSAKVESCVFDDIGDFDTLKAVYYRAASRNDNHYKVIAAAVAARATTPVVLTSTVTDTGVLAQASRTFDDGGNTVNQFFEHYRVAGIYAYQAEGSNIKTNTVSTSVYGMYIDVSSSGVGGPMTFDVIIDNIFRTNTEGGAHFLLSSVVRSCQINVSDNDLVSNGEGSTSGLEDCGLVIAARDCTGALTVIAQQNNMNQNHARGAFLDVHNHDAKLTVLVTNSNTFSQNRGAGLLVNLDTVDKDFELVVEESSFTQNNPQLTNDPGALALQGGTLRRALKVRLDNVTASRNTGHGLGINMGGLMAVNLAQSTSYVFHQCTFNGNTQRGIFLLDSYGANAQNSKYEWRGITTGSNDAEAVYVHSNSQLGNINFLVDGLSVPDPNNVQGAVVFQMAADTYNPRSRIQDLAIPYQGAAGAATGLMLQGDEEDNRWKVDMTDCLIFRPGVGMDVQFCEVEARRCNLTGEGDNSIIARDSNVHLYDCDVPELSAQTQATTLNAGVFFYEWFNISKVTWQNGQPIRNTTFTIFHDLGSNEELELYEAMTDRYGDLPNREVAYWIRDDNNRQIKNDALKARANIRGDIVETFQTFDFFDEEISMDDPDLPELFINTPSEGTVQKSGTLIIQGEIRDTHSGIKAVEVTLDNVVWYNITELKNRVGQGRASFRHEIRNLTDSVYTITVRGWDVARWDNITNGVALRTIKNVKIDTEPPFLQVTSPPEQFWVTKNKNFIIGGQTERSVHIRKLTINDMEVDIFGSTFSQNFTLIEGTNTFVIIVEDSAGNIAVATRQVVLDTVPPTLYVTTPRMWFSSKEKDFEVAGDTEQTATVRVQLDDRNPVEVFDRGGTRFYFKQTIRTEGWHTISVISEDLAGNVMVEEVTVKYDVTPPVLEDIVPGESSRPTNNQRLYVAGRTDKEVENVEINDLIFNVSNGVFAEEINLLEGLQTVTIRVVDAAGNENMTTRTILIDVTPPLMTELTVSSTKAGGRVWEVTEDVVINERSVRFRCVVDQDDWREVWFLVGDDNRSGLEEAGADNTFWRDFNLDEGENLVSVIAIDRAGNQVLYSYKLNVDPRPPEVQYFNPRFTGALEAVVKENTVLISGQVNEFGVTLMINNRQIAIRPDTKAFQTNVPLEEGVNNIEVVATDRAGNTASEILRISYEPKSEDEDSFWATLGKLWWVFGIIIGLVIAVPIVAQLTRGKWVELHPELEDYNPRLAREGAYDYEDDYGYDQQGGGWR